jgi:serpin B
VAFGLSSCSSAGPAQPSAADKAAVVKGNNEFALELYARLREQDGNLFFSPYSISTALGLTYAGARNKTAEEMAKTLHFTLDNDRLHPAFGAIMKDLNGDGKDRPFQLLTANALWVQKDFKFLDDFLKLAKTNYDAAATPVDFKNDTENARQTINEWVEKQTKDKIKELFKPGVLNTDSRLVLTNAIYFMGNWANPFNEKTTREGEFQVSKEKKVKVPMMHQTEPFNHGDAGDFELLEMPYKGEQLSFVVLLPKKDELKEVEKDLTLDKLTAALGKMHRDRVYVSMPRFKMTSEFQLNKVLSEMGMPTAFSDAADLSGLNGSTNLFIQAVVHKAYVDVNEKGTEAAAATGIGVGVKSMPKEFLVNRPFLFLIRDMKSGSILFVGRVVEPQA